MHIFCADCSLPLISEPCSIPGHRSFQISRRYRIPRKNRRKAWKAISSAALADETLPLTENRLLEPKGRCCPHPHTYKALPTTTEE